MHCLEALSESIHVYQVAMMVALTTMDIEYSYCIAARGSLEALIQAAS